MENPIKIAMQRNVPRYKVRLGDGLEMEVDEHWIMKDHEGQYWTAGNRVTIVEAPKNGKYKKNA